MTLKCFRRLKVSVERRLPLWPGSAHSQTKIDVLLKQISRNAYFPFRLGHRRLHYLLRINMQSLISYCLGFNHFYKGTLLFSCPFGVTGRVLEPLPAAYEQSQCTSLKESQGIGTSFKGTTVVLLSWHPTPPTTFHVLCTVGFESGTPHPQPRPSDRYFYKTRAHDLL